ncbi:unnamed protein product [Cunninghamella blakesleeana]
MYQSSNFEEEAFGVRRTVDHIKSKNKPIEPTLFTKNPLTKKQNKNVMKGNNNLKKHNIQPAANEIAEGISFADALSGAKSRKIITSQVQQPLEKLENNDDNINDEDDNKGVVIIEKETQMEPQISSTSTLPPNEKEPSIHEEQKNEPIHDNHDNIKAETTDSNPKTLEEIEAQLRSTSSHPNNHDHPIQNNNNNNLIGGNGGNNLLHVLLPGLSPNPPPPPQQQQPVQRLDAHPQSNVPFDINTFFRNHQQRQQQGHFIPLPNVSAINRDLVQKPNLTIEQELKQNKEDNVDGDSSEGSNNKSNHDVEEHQRVLKIVDDLYALLLELEQLNRNRDQMEQSKFSVLVTEKVDAIWKIFNIEDSSNIVSILSVSKGQTLISRVLPYISDYQQNGLMTIIASHIADLPFRPSELEVNKVDLVDYKEKLELRLSFLMRHVSAFLVQSPLSYIIDALSYTANHSNFNCLIASMSGQGYLGNLLSNALSKAEHQPMNEEESKKYTLAIDQIFNKFMDNIPLLVTMATIENTSLWILINSLATSCNPNQFKRLMNEFRGIILMTLNNIECMKRSYQNISFSAKLTYPILVKLNETLNMHEF